MPADDDDDLPFFCGFAAVEILFFVVVALALAAVGLVDLDAFTLFFMMVWGGRSEKPTSGVADSCDL